jgi:hypothetical protein
MELLTMKYAHFRADMITLIKALKKTIHDDYRVEGCEDSTTPMMQVTIGADANGWNYQTGDNSYTGGAYGYATWAVVTIDRRTNSKVYAEVIISELEENAPDDAPIFDGEK